MSQLRNELSLTGRLVATLGPLAGPISLSVVLRIVSQGLGIVLLVLGGWTAGALIGGQAIDLGPLVLLLVGLGVLKAAARYGEQVSGHGVAFETLALLRLRAFEALGRQAPVLPGGLSSGDLVSRLVADIDRLEVFYAHTIGPVLTALVLGVAVVVTAGVWGGTGVAVALGVGYGLVALGVPVAAYWATRGTGAAVRRGKGRLASVVSAFLRGAEDLYWSQADAKALDRVNAAGDAVFAQQARAATMAGLKDGATDLVISATLLSLVFLVAGLPPAVIGALVALAAGSFAPALSVGRAFDDLPETASSARRLFEILDTPPTVTYPSPPSDAPSTGAPGEGPLGLAFLNVSFGWDRPLFQHLDLDVPPGARVCVLGPSGGGKTTLAKLMVRFFDPQGGTILLGGIELRRWTQGDLRQRLVYLDQESFVLDGTVAENLDTFKPGLGADQWDQTLDAVGLWPGAPGRLDRPVGPRGRLISGGERKRLTLARALGGSPGLVVLDEAFNNLDARTRRLVRSRVLEAARGLTIVEVTHEEDDAEGADLVLRVHHGQVTAVV